MVRVKTLFFNEPKYIRFLIIKNYIKDYINTISKYKNKISLYIKSDS